METYQNKILNRATLNQLKIIEQRIGGFQIEEDETAEAIITTLKEEYGLQKLVAWLEILQPIEPEPLKIFGQEIIRKRTEPILKNYLVEVDSYNNLFFAIGENEEQARISVFKDIATGEEDEEELFNDIEINSEILMIVGKA